MPFFAGTYFPKAPRYGMPAFVQVLERRARDGIDEHPTKCARRTRALAQFLADHSRGDAHAAATRRCADPHALATHRSRVRSARTAAIVGAPKFPHAGEIELLPATARARRRHDHAGDLRATGAI